MRAMSVEARFIISARFGDVLGTHLYDNYGGFYICVVLTTLCYVLILPMHRLVPREYTDSADGQIVAVPVT